MGMLTAPTEIAHCSEEVETALKATWVPHQAQSVALVSMVPVSQALLLLQQASLRVSVLAGHQRLEMAHLAMLVHLAAVPLPRQFLPGVGARRPLLP